MRKIIDFFSMGGSKEKASADAEGKRLEEETQEDSSSLESFLRYYISLKEPGYAVLVTGAWGVGKTYQVKSHIPETARVYVSLFGVSSVEQLHAEVFSSAYPMRAKISEGLERSREAASQAGGLASFASLVPSLVGSQLKRDFDVSRVLIFDDLERSSLRQKDILGAINFYVEQLGARVVVIAHDAKLAEGFRQVQEKVFGQTLRVVADFDAAFERFVSKVEGARAQETIRRFQQEIRNIFSQSSIGSLRVLRRGLDATGRLIEVLDDDIFEEKRVLEEIVKQYFVYTVEVAAGRLSEPDLVGRRTARHSFHLRQAANREAPVEVPAFVAMLERYPTIELDDDLFEDQVLISAVIGGSISRSEVNAMFRDSHHLAAPAKMPSWRLAMLFDEYGAKVAELGFKRLTKELQSFEIVQSGEILHAAAMHFMLSARKILDRTADQVLSEFCTYIDELVSRGLLAPSETRFRWHRDFDESFGGYGYWVEDSYRDKFGTLLRYLLDSRQKVLESKFPEIGATLLKLVQSDPSKFFELVSPTNNGENPYARVPVLKSIDPSAFVDGFVSAPSFSSRYVRFALENRYASGELQRDLASEREWLVDVRRILRERMDAAQGFEKVRIERLLPTIPDDKVQ